MSKDDRLKKRLLREAIEDNLDTMSAIRRLNRERRRRRIRIWTRRLVLGFGSPIALFGAFQIVHAVSPTEVATPAPIVAAPPKPAPPVQRPEPPSLPESFDAAPQPIDPAVFPLGVRHVVVDPGHGGRSPGTSGPQGLIEKDLALDIGLRLRELLKAASYDVTMTRDADTTLSLDDRAHIANGAKGDIFVSIHLNWFPQQDSRGVETFYVGATDDPELNALAAQENLESGYSLSDMRRLLDEVYLDVRKAESRRLAESIHATLFSGVRKVNPAIQDRGVKTAPFIVLLATDMPAILAEVSCLSHAKEAALVADAKYRQKIAESLFAGIRNFARTSSEGAKGA